MSETTIVLPGRDDMLRRLKGAINSPHMERGFYPLLLKYAGTEKAPEGIGVMFVLAIADYTRGMPAVLQQTLGVALPRLVAAVVDDADVRRETLEFIEAARS